MLPKQPFSWKSIPSGEGHIGQEIEKFVEEANIGGDTWHQTSVLTFDGNTCVKSKVTYKRFGNT